MKVNNDAIRQRMIDKFCLSKEARVGTASSFCKEQRITGEGADGADIVMVATTSDIDVEREVVVPEGANTSYFFQNRSIFVDHYYDFQHCIGKLRSAMPFDGPNGEQLGWYVRFHVFPLTKSPFANDIMTFARDGQLACSIGFEAVDHGKPTAKEITRYKQGDAAPQSIVREWNWLELSVTMFPANVNAGQVGLFMPGETGPGPDVEQKRLEYMDGLLTKGKIARATAEAFGMPGLKKPKRRVIVDI